MAVPYPAPHTPPLETFFTQGAHPFRVEVFVLPGRLQAFDVTNPANPVWCGYISYLPQLNPTGQITHMEATTISVAPAYRGKRLTAVLGMAYVLHIQRNYPHPPVGEVLVYGNLPDPNLAAIWDKAGLDFTGAADRQWNLIRAAHQNMDANGIQRDRQVDGTTLVSQLVRSVAEKKAADSMFGALQSFLAHGTKIQVDMVVVPYLEAPLSRIIAHAAAAIARGNWETQSAANAAAVVAQQAAHLTTAGKSK
ncbi:MAG: hypothetical protein MMC33_006238 [Icmadophila ericetorum]|nr:hypothetical protein [Icmadophila ericetorum]